MQIMKRKDMMKVVRAEESSYRNDYACAKGMHENDILNHSDGFGDFSSFSCG